MKSVPSESASSEPTLAQVVAPEIYRSLGNDLDAEIARSRRVDRAFGVARLASFAAVLIALLIAITGGGGWFWLFAVAAAGIFLVVVTANEPTRVRLSQDLSRRRLLRQLDARVSMDWDRLSRLNADGPTSDPARGLSADALAVAADLDLLGRASLFRRVSICFTPDGIATLSRWMTGPAMRGDALERAELSTAMADRREARMEFYELASRVVESAGPPDEFAAWASGPRWLEERRWVTGWAKASATLSLLALIGLSTAAFILAARQTPPAWTVRLASVTLFVLVAVVLLNLLLSTVALSPMHRIFAVAMSNRRTISAYRRLTALAVGLVQPTSASGDGNRLRDEVLHHLAEGDRAAMDCLSKLDRIALAGSLRTNALTFLIYLPMQLLGLYDVWILRRLEDWQAQFGTASLRWFRSIGIVEAAASVAAVRDEETAWNDPVWSDHLTLVAEQLGHPLLSPSQRVANDVTIGPAGTFLLVTGSNMSGKSTMLRPSIRQCFPPPRT